MKYYLYQHIRLDKQKTFYIGIGSKSKYFKSTKNEYRRAYSKNNRNNLWKNVTNKTDYDVIIVCQSDNYEEIKQKEVEFIKFYGRKDLGLGNLVNMTNGGEGNRNVIRSKIWNKKISISNCGKTRSEVTKSKIKKAREKQDMSHKYVAVEQYSIKGEYLKSFDSIEQAIKFIGQKNSSNITSVCRGKRKQCGGFIWKYKIINDSA